MCNELLIFSSECVTCWPLSTYRSSRTWLYVLNPLMTDRWDRFKLIWLLWSVSKTSVSVSVQCIQFSSVQLVFHHKCLFFVIFAEKNVIFAEKSNLRPKKVILANFKSWKGYIFLAETGILWVRITYIGKRWWKKQEAVKFTIIKVMITFWGGVRWYIFPEEQ